LSTVDELKKILEASEKSLEIQRLLEFQKLAMESGYLRKQEYVIPPVDTIGRRTFELTKAIVKND